ncbi:nuclear prelamin A recognition factor isoform X1 [Sphaerodactylus townsendi]|uniref:nuclear prelamin A recognition factor isoform X1 n=1 Tax=Sphaerodactylus townsendi TaxID=933632 RepID=UPI00202644D8|nr:nuclear prelamin A recognition factor isoform X1 [Sphaerodactylus townsendi]XP_048344643.1 nuclear prelamin A recognition factor isoform X1 [Sphaerodactylus townsendi]
MKCENCTKKECSKKPKNDEQQSMRADVLNSDEENEEKSEFHKLANAKIFLSDCLACENCITSEEAVRVFQQNQKELFQVLNLNKKCDTSKHKVVAVSICPQSLPYFAAKFNICVTEAAKRLCGFLRSLGVHYVFDTTIAADFSILESQKEFVQRYRHQSQEEYALPMFASACPGWIQYAERVLSSLVTPYICTAKSPQQIMGSLVKGYFAKQQNLSPDKIFHVIVAPCYDKKLEALREDFYNPLYSSRDVDCVLTSGEIFQIMEQRKTSLKEVKEVAFDTLFGGIKEGELIRHDGRRSDGYLEHIFKHAAKELFDIDVKEITYRVLKNKDFQEVTLEKEGETVLRFAATYGFRNIQNMVLKLKKGKCVYHFVEVLACPGGCLNGKGQAQTEDGKPDRALLRQMEDVYAAVPVQLPENSEHVQKLYQEWLEGIDSTRVRETLHTKYSMEKPTANSFDIKW